jgi:DNA polymerase-3 subunit delta
LIIQDLEELEAEVNRGRLHPAYVVLGPEGYLSQQAYVFLKQRLLAPEAFAFNYAEFSAQDCAARQAVEAAETFPMMAPRRLVVLTDLDRTRSADHEVLLAYLENPSPRSIVILTARDLDRRTSFYRRLRETACVVECPKLKGYALERWAESFIRKHGCRISQSALSKTVALAAEDLQSLVNELEKLLIYAGNEKLIPDEAVEDLVSSSRQHTIFELTGALGKKDRETALRHLANLIDSGEEPLGIVSMMARHFRQILVAKDLLEQGKNPRDVAAAAQVPPFVLEGFMRSVRAIDSMAAAEMYRSLAEADYRFKSSPADKRMVLEHLICSLGTADRSTRRPSPGR